MAFLSLAEYHSAQILVIYTVWSKMYNSFHRAMGGDKSIGENYAFAGMHHIFDQHKAAGESLFIIRFIFSLWWLLLIGAANFVMCSVVSKYSQRILLFHVSFCVLPNKQQVTYKLYFFNVLFPCIPKGSRGLHPNMRVNPIHLEWPSDLRWPRWPPISLVHSAISLYQSLP